MVYWPQEVRYLFFKVYLIRCNKGLFCLLQIKSWLSFISLLAWILTWFVLFNKSRCLRVNAYLMHNMRKRPYCMWRHLLRSSCSVSQSTQLLCCMLAESMNITEYITDQWMPCSDSVCGWWWWWGGGDGRGDAGCSGSSCTLHKWHVFSHYTWLIS